MTNRTRWTIDEAHSGISFKVRHLMIANVKGAFKTFDASIYTTGNDFSTAEINLSIDAGSITTGNAKRDEHLKGVDFFDVNNHKQIIFISSTIGEPGPDDIYKLPGKLTMKGVTRNVKLKMRFGGIINDPAGVERAGLSVIGKLNRSDWGLMWNSVIETGGLMVSEEVMILCDIELINTSKSDLKMELQQTGVHEVSP